MENTTWQEVSRSFATTSVSVFYFVDHSNLRELFSLTVDGEDMKEKKML